MNIKHRAFIFSIGCSAYEIIGQVFVLKLQDYLSARLGPGNRLMIGVKNIQYPVFDHRAGGAQNVNRFVTKDLVADFYTGAHINPDCFDDRP